MSNEDGSDLMYSYIQGNKKEEAKDNTIENAIEVVTEDVELICNSQELVDLTQELAKVRLELQDSQIESEQRQQNIICLKAALEDSLASIQKKHLENEERMTALTVQNEQKISAILLEHKERMKSAQLEKEIQLNAIKQENEKKNHSILQENEKKSSTTQQDHLKVISQLQKELASAEGANVLLRQEIGTRKANQSDLQTQLSEMQGKLKELQKDKDAQAALVKGFEAELHKLQNRIAQAALEVQESNKINQSCIRKNNQLSDEKREMFSQIESVNSIFEEIQNLKQQIATYDELFNNLDMDILLSNQMPKIEEKVQAHHGDKSEFRRTLLIQMANPMLETIQAALQMHHIPFTYKL